MKESDLYSPCVAGMMKDGWAAHKIADGSVGEKPGDIIGSTPTGLAFLLELKAPAKSRASTLDWGLFLPHQEHWLRAYARRGAVPLAGVYDRQRHVLMVWRLRFTHDMCARRPDYELWKTAGVFVGWPDSPAERKSSAEQLRGTADVPTEEDEPAVDDGRGDQVPPVLEERRADVGDNRR